MLKLLSMPLIFILKGLIQGYRLFISPLLGHNCRFAPTCSSYALEAFEIHGLIKGSFLSLKRISQCHPWGKSGFDPVPQSTHFKK
ncbi:membrane protein insertion efficiency factor YidD [Candidatus Nucleicultrix amoebiphila]|jgi:putative membrane protein insertion efficiency factor|uniref:Putative membrane protein insertion efficiency factor n=1 Tax=Candidatus Nucleicultrix amoebiphila FS5 TaxID=1414854 RepID=A0A1W6N5V2_9PROT|nr:membrane protein insertion efficiency factor YidD [Candidatus Nucleicultrix amoebiphila]ARN85213.1 hypothetical protein GQ61_07860 [Candidatus Nucleicultrix amoebiphila FS5]